MKKTVSAIAVLLMLCILMPVFAMGVFALPAGGNAPAYSDAPKTSARAADNTDGTLELDNTGRLWFTDGDTYSLLANLGASSMIVTGNTLYYAADDEIRTYDLFTGMIGTVIKASGVIRNFCLDGGKIVYLTPEAIFVRNGKKTQKIGENPDKIGLEADGSLILYYENPKYLDENVYDVGLLESENDEYITYKWNFASGEAELFDPTEPTLDEMIFNADDSSYVINGVAFPLSNYPVGSFFTKNGESCDCHNRGICVEARSSKGCNCMRYWPSERNYQIDLAASQCMGFARFCQYMVYQKIDYSDNKESGFLNVFGKQLSAGAWTASKLKSYLTEAGAGGHLRTGSGHSLFVISVNSTGFVTYECNKSTYGGYCQIYTRTWTWESFFAKYGSRALLYYNMPDMEIHTNDTDDDGYKTGYYLITAESGLRLRSNHSTSGTTTLDLLPLGTLVQVTEIYRVSDDEYWGKVKYEGQSGWISMEYAAYQNATVKSIKITQNPSKTTYIEGDVFSTAGLEVSALFTSGISTPISGYTCSGYSMTKVGKQTVKVTYQGCTASFSIEVLQKKIEPTAIKFKDTLLVLLHGDSVDLNETVTITPSNATERELTWTCSNQDSDYIRFENGKLTAMNDCSATITVRTSNGKTATCEVLITHLPQDNEKEFSDVLPKLPVGITPQDYLVQYKKGTGAWTSYSSDDEVVYKSDYSYRFRNYIVDVIVSGASAPGYPASTNVGTKFDLSKGIFKQDHTASALFAGFTVSEENKTPQACGSTYFTKGDAVFYARTISLSQMTLTADARDTLNFGQTGLAPFALAGVGVRIDDDPDYFGLRFYTRLSKRLLTEISSLYSKNKNIAPASDSDKGIGYGSVVVLKSGLGSSELVKGKSSSTYLKDKAVVTVPAVCNFAEYDNYIVYTALVCGYTSDYYKTDFAVRPYLTFFTCNGVQTSFYYKVTGQNSKSGAYYTNLYAEAKAVYESLTADTPENVSSRKWYEDKFGFNA